MIRNAEYQRQHPVADYVRDLAAWAFRPTRILLLCFALALAAHFGAPVHRVIPSPVKDAYAEVHAWRDSNTAAMRCSTKHVAATKSGQEQKIAEAERICEDALRRR